MRTFTASVSFTVEAESPEEAARIAQGWIDEPGDELVWAVTDELGIEVEIDVAELPA